MPARNSIKQFVENSYYHIYNRGVEKRNIFLDSQDYNVFLSYLKTYLLPKDIISLQKSLSDPNTEIKEKDKIIKLLRMNNFADSISLTAYCLMSNHFHFLIKQQEANSIDRFTNSFFTRYTMFFNKKYKRVGPLFEGVYKAVLVLSDEQLLYLTRYIHRNPISEDFNLRNYPYSSYKDYLGLRKTPWLKPKDILDYFSRNQQGFSSYESFVEDTSLEEQSIDQISSIILD